MIKLILRFILFNILLTEAVVLILRTFAIVYMDIKLISLFVYFIKRKNEKRRPVKTHGQKSSHEPVTSVYSDPFVT